MPSLASWNSCNVSTGIECELFRRSLASKGSVIGYGTKWLPWLMFGNAIAEVYVRLSNAEYNEKRPERNQLQVLSRERFLTNVYSDVNNIRQQIQ
jgi:hypothetical protein